MGEHRRCMLVIIGAPLVVCGQTTAGNGTMGQQGCSGCGLPLAGRHPKLARVACGHETPRLEVVPKLVGGDLAMGFWAALLEVYGKTRVQRCRVHRTANVPNALPKSVQPKAKAHLKDILMAQTSAKADAAFDFFVEAYGVKYDRAVKCLTKDRTDLPAFCDFPAEHWKHIRTSNPIESTFATVRHRTTKTKGCLSRQTALAMTYQLRLSAKKKWRKLNGQNRLPEIIQAVEFRDGIQHEIKAA